MADEQDQILVEEIRKGNVRRYGALVDRHKYAAMTLAVRLIEDRREAEEAVQDAFVRAFQSLDKFRGDSAFSTWFYRILYNGCLSRLRRRKGAPHSVELEEGHGAEDDDPGVDQMIERSDTQAVIGEELARLPENCRTALTLFYVQEMKYEEIAAVMNVPMGTVKTFLFRGKQQLRGRLQERLRSEVRVA